MKAVQIGKYTISKKGILFLAFLLFFIGGVIGGVIVPSGNFLITIFPIGFIIAIWYPQIKKEITITEKMLK